MHAGRGNNREQEQRGAKEIENEDRGAVEGQSDDVDMLITVS